MLDYNDADTYEPAYGWDWDDIWGGDTACLINSGYPVLRWLTLRFCDDFYVKTGGDDREGGASWATAWKTVNIAMELVLDGKTIHIGYGTYDAEPAGNKVMPVNAGSNGIKIYPEKDDGTGQTVGGTIKIEVV